MKLAWLCFVYEEDNTPEFRTREPDPCMFWKVIPIVYSELEEA